MKLIQLVEFDDDHIWLNPDHILMMHVISGEVGGPQTNIIVEHARDVLVQETPQEIQRLIAAAPDLSGT